jgi:hypothetical protein
MKQQLKAHWLKTVLILIIVFLGVRYVKDRLYANYLRGAFSLSMYIDCFKDMPTINTLNKMYRIEAFSCDEWAKALFPVAVEINQDEVEENESAD